MRIIAEEEREAVILVLQVERRAQVLGLLIDEAENAVTFAGAQLQRFDLPAGVFATVEVKARFQSGAIPLHDQVRAVLAHVKAQIQQILHRMPIDFDYEVARLEAG